MRNLLAFILLVIAAASTVAAQQATPWMQVTIVQVDPASVDEFIVAERDYANRIRRGGPQWRIVSRTEGFGDNYRFVILSPLQNLASLDAAARNTDAEVTALANRVQKYVKSQQSYAVRAVPEVGKPMPANQAPALILINIARIFPGREQDYLNVMRTDFLPHFDKANFNHVTGVLAFGGENAYVHLFYVPNFAKLDEGSPVVKALGAAGAQAVTAKLSGIVSGTEQWIVRLIPDLSYGPWSPAPRTP